MLSLRKVKGVLLQTAFPATSKTLKVRKVFSVHQGAQSAYFSDVGATSIESNNVSETYGAHRSDIPDSDTRHVSGRQQLERTFSGIPSLSERTSLIFKTSHTPGGLQSVIQLFSDHGLNMTHIESRPNKLTEDLYEFSVDFEGHIESSRIQSLLSDLKSKDHCQDVYISDPAMVPWFPQKITDLDSFATKTLDAGSDLEADHPGFHDEVYRTRRSAIVEGAKAYRFGNEIPRVDYSESETRTWSTVYKKLKELYPKYACSQFNR